jgi:hypothetical protein
MSTPQFESGMRECRNNPGTPQSTRFVAGRLALLKREAEKIAITESASR